MGQLTQLTLLYLSDNQLSGPIPAALGNLTALEELSLHNNALGGPIPAALGNLTALIYLSLRNNALNGPIPSELGQLTALTELYLQHNARYVNAALSGPLPSSFSALTNLTELPLQNTLTTVPAALESWAAGLTVTTGSAARSGMIPLAAANTAPVGVWANATTLYVSDALATPPRVFAYTLADGRHDPANDIALDAENTGAQGLWSDGTTLWVADVFDHKLYAYTLAGGGRDMAKDIALAETWPRDLWADGTTLWVVDLLSNVYAYTLADRSRDTDNDFPAPLPLANFVPRGIWSDETTVWVADAEDAWLYAYTLADGSPDAAKGRALDPVNTAPRGVWADGTTWYVADADDGVVYIYGQNRPPEAVGTLPDLTMGIAERGTAPQTMPLALAFRDPDGDALRYLDPHIRSEDMREVAVGWVSEGLLNVLGTTLGRATVTVQAVDPGGLIATQQFTVTVVDGPPANQGPQAVGVLPDLELAVYGSPYPVAVADGFMDPDGDALTYRAASSSPTVATVRISGSEVTIEPVSVGTTTITVTATDPGGLTVTQQFTVTTVGSLPAQPPVTPPPPPSTPGSGGGGGGGGGGSQPQDQHGNSPGQATRIVPPASTVGEIAPTGDQDYFRLEAPHAGVLSVETTGPTNTVGTVWQDGEQLATAATGGSGSNFRIEVAVEAGPVVLAVTGQGRATGPYRLRTTLVVGVLENPGPGSRQSGIGLLSGWVCDAEVVELEINGTQRVVAAYGTDRADTAATAAGEELCGDTDNGFGLLFNWNLLGDGVHTVVALADGVAFDQATFTVTTLGVEFVEDVRGETVVEDFPTAGEAVRLVWQETNQNFVLASLDRSPPPASPPSPASGPLGRLENPGPGSFQSGIGLVSGWVCEAEVVVVEIIGIDRTYRLAAAYGTDRADTLETAAGAELCGDTDNGFGLLFNWNLLGDGVHTVRALADGAEFGRATFTVATLGEEFVEDVRGETVVEDFPSPGERVRLVWQQATQSFVLAPLQ